MKTFVIKAPGKGKTTCTMVRQFYDKASRRTKTTYLGSFNLALDPLHLPIGIKARPGFEFDASTVGEVRNFLERHGSSGRPPVLSAEILAEARRQIGEEIAAAGGPGQRKPDLDIAAAVLNQAALDLMSRAAELRAQGVHLSPGFLNFIGTEAENCLTAMDHLKVHSNRIRAAAWGFELALKECRLMKRVSKPLREPLQPLA